MSWSMHPLARRGSTRASGRGRLATAAVALALAAAGCGASQAEVAEARRSGYKADFAIVYKAALDTVKDLYPRFVEDASKGEIKTAWHPIQVQPNQTGQTPGNQYNGGRPVVRASIDREMYFIRVSVNVVGGNPWRVKVRGEASLWEAGAVPTKLDGADEPHWLKGRINALRVKIHEKLSKHAVDLFEREKEAPAPEPKVVDTSQFGDIPAPAARRLAAVKAAAESRNMQALRTHMADSFTWSLGAAASADQAIAMWQADISILDELVRVLAAGCGYDEAATRVVCPSEADGSGQRTTRARFEPVGDGWRMVLFIAGGD